MIEFWSDRIQDRIRSIGRSDQSDPIENPQNRPEEIFQKWKLFPGPQIWTFPPESYISVRNLDLSSEVRALGMGMGMGMVMGRGMSMGMCIGRSHRHIYE